MLYIFTRGLVCDVTCKTPISYVCLRCAYAIKHASRTSMKSNPPKAQVFLSGKETSLQ